MNKKLVIAIDGPAGSGKSTVSKLVAKRLGLLYLDTGAMYRALTLKVMRAGVKPEDKAAAVRIAASADIHFITSADSDPQVLLDGEDVSREIRTPEVTQHVKHVACIPGVRKRMVQLQRAIAEKQGAVVEGRDIGTVVLRNTPFKYYIDATAEERAQRRFKELTGMGMNVNLEEIKADVIARDASDIHRKVGPLRKAKDAIRIDTTSLSIEQVVDKLVTLIQEAS
jgi:cytidylate kinase